MILAFCSAPAAKLTLGRSVPSMVARKSWVIGSDAERTRCGAINSHRASRCSTPCSRLQPAVCAICKPKSTENRSISWRNCGASRRNSASLETGIRSPSPVICTTSRSGLRFNPASAGIVGREGLVGIPALAGLNRSPLREVVQITGDGLRMPVSRLAEFLREAPQLRHEMERFSVLLGLQMAQTAGCNRLHGVEQRLARWLLMAQDRVSSASLPITHDFLATMLGTDRPSVSLAAGALQKANIIEYNRGSVKILNRAELERASCECYGVIRRYTDEA